MFDALQRFNSGAGKMGKAGELCACPNMFFILF